MEAHNEKARSWTLTVIHGVPPRVVGTTSATPSEPIAETVLQPRAAENVRERVATWPNIPPGSFETGFSARQPGDLC